MKSEILNLHDVVINGQILIWLQICFHHLKQFSIRYGPVYEVLTPGKDGLLVRCGSVRVQLARSELRSSLFGRSFSSDFFWAGKIFMLTFRFFYKKMKIVFLVKYRHRVRNFPRNRNWHRSQGMNAITWGKH